MWLNLLKCVTQITQMWKRMHKTHKTDESICIIRFWINEYSFIITVTLFCRKISYVAIYALSGKKVIGQKFACVNFWQIWCLFGRLMSYLWKGTFDKSDQFWEDKAQSHKLELQLRSPSKSFSVEF